MADIILWKRNKFRGSLGSKVFKVADYEFDIGFSEFKMANLILQTYYFGNLMIFVELCTQRFLRSLITNLTSNCHFSKWRVQYEILETLRFSHNSNSKSDFQNSV